ncbi:MAG: hypothetical protein P1P82_10635 [Bacteroidales bacterium]|nr:hypothetical protein [Bacteroidales bacterium]MDT8431821.1 hypothetical protein [Bacteroidales bacterium]
MNAVIIEDQLHRIRNDLAAKGLTYESLQDDILDHLCCMIEEKLEAGEAFDVSYGEIMSDIDGNTFSNLQHQTLLLLDYKFQRMKRTTYLLGLLGSLLTIVGALFKIMHWPGAGIIMVLGFMTVVLGFLPLYFILSYREQTEKPNVIFPVVGYLSLLIVFTGAVFKIMHWPGAEMLLRASVIFLLVGFLPLYIVQIFKRSVKTKINPAYIIMLLVGFSIVLILVKVNISKDSIDRYTEIAVDYRASTGVIDSALTNMLEAAGDSAITPDMKKVMSLSEELKADADEMLQGLLAGVDQAGVPIEEVSRKDFRNAGRDAFLDNGLAYAFLEKSGEFKDVLVQLVEDPVLQDQLELDFLFADGQWINGWDPEDDANDPLVINYKIISEFKWKVVSAEYKVMKYLLSEE